MMYPFSLPQRRLYQIGLWTLACSIAGLSGCNDNFKCPANGMTFTDRTKCEESCQPLKLYRFPPFTRDRPGQSAKIHLFIDGNGPGGVKDSELKLDCSASDCGLIMGEPFCQEKSACTKDFEAGAVVTLTPTAGKDSSFYGWGGDEDCQDGVVTVTGTDIYCIAVFSLTKVTKCE